MLIIQDSLFSFAVKLDNFIFIRLELKLSMCVCVLMSVSSCVSITDLSKTFTIIYK